MLAETMNETIDDPNPTPSEKPIKVEPAPQNPPKYDCLHIECHWRRQQTHKEQLHAPAKVKTPRRACTACANTNKAIQMAMTLENKLIENPEMLRKLLETLQTQPRVEKLQTISKAIHQSNRLASSTKQPQMGQMRSRQNRAARFVVKTLNIQLTGSIKGADQENPPEEIARIQYQAQNTCRCPNPHNKQLHHKFETICKQCKRHRTLQQSAQTPENCASCGMHNASHLTVHQTTRICNLCSALWKLCNYSTQTRTKKLQDAIRNKIQNAYVNDQQNNREEEATHQNDTQQKACMETTPRENEEIQTRENTGARQHGRKTKKQGNNKIENTIQTTAQQEINTPQNKTTTPNEARKGTKRKRRARSTRQTKRKNKEPELPPLPNTPLQPPSHLPNPFI